MSLELKDNENVLPLQRGCIYGPVSSRRLGASLGLNVLPQNKKICSFNCIYCQYGLTTPENLLVAGSPATAFPTVADIEKALLAALSSLKQEINFITFSGNGEPTLHPQFPEIVGAVQAIRKRYFPSVKLAILSNATTLSRPEISSALRGLDLAIMKLDAGIEQIYRRINRPAEGLEFNEVIKSLIAFEHPGKNIQALIMGGKELNFGDENLRAWAMLLRTIKPADTQIYSLARPPAQTGIRAASHDQLRKFASRAAHISGIKITVY